MNFKERYKYNTATDLLGKGGFSRVFKATDILLEREVALKIFNTEQSARYDLIAEIKKVIKLDHPNLCRYFDVAILESTNALGETEKTQVGIMEYLDGGDIKTYLKKHPEKRDQLLRDVLKGLSFLHKNGIIHRDLKPQNILIKNTIDGPIAKITDFGISKALSNEQSSSSTLLGTIEYMAPEQFNPSKYGINGFINTNLDLWSFGLMIYELIKGESLFGSRGSNTSAEQVMSNILSDDYYLKLESLPEPYKKVVKSCLIKEASKRTRDAIELLPMFGEKQTEYQTATAAGNETQIIKPVSLETVQINVSQPKNEPRPVRPVIAKKRSNGKIFIAAGVGLLIVAVFSGWWFMNRSDNKSGSNNTLAFEAAKKEIDAQNFEYGINLLTDEYDHTSDKKSLRSMIEKAYRSKWMTDSIRTEIYRTGDYLDVEDFHEGLAAVNKKGLYGYIDQTGKIVIEPKFTEARQFMNGFAIIIENNKYGFINKQGAIIGNAEYDYANHFAEGMAAVNKNGKWGYIDETGKQVVSLEYDIASDFFGEKAIVAKDGKYGLINNRNEKVVPMEYDYALGLITNPDIVILNKNKKFFLADNKGKYISKEYDEFYFTSGVDVIRIRNGNRYGYINWKGEEIIPLDYDDASNEVTEGRFLVKANGKFGFINKENKKITEFIYDSCSGFNNSYAAVKRNNKWGFIDVSGKEVIPLDYDEVDIFRGDCAIVRRGSKYGVIDNKNTEIIPFDYDGLESSDMDNEIFTGRKDKKLGVIDKQKKVILDFVYDVLTVSNDHLFISASNSNKSIFYDKTSNNTIETPTFVEMNRYKSLGKNGMVSGADLTNETVTVFDFIKRKNITTSFYSANDDYSLWPFKKNGKYGFMNYNFNEKIPAIYDKAFSFSDGLASVKKGGKWGFIDQDGNEVIPFKYGDDEAGVFHSGMAWISTNDQFGFINKQGSLVINGNGKFDNLHDFSDFNLAKVRKSGKWGVIDNKGNVVVEPAYTEDGIDFISLGIEVTKNGDKGLLDFSGKQLIPSNYHYFAWEGDLIACYNWTTSVNGFYSLGGQEYFKGEYIGHTSISYTSNLVPSIFYDENATEKVKYYNLYGKEFIEQIFSPLTNGAYQFNSNLKLKEAVLASDSTAAR